jgi:hypothetical protein
LHGNWHYSLWNNLYIYFFKASNPYNSISSSAVYSLKRYLPARIRAIWSDLKYFNIFSLFWNIARLYPNSSSCTYSYLNQNCICEPWTAHWF